MHPFQISCPYTFPLDTVILNNLPLLRDSKIKMVMISLTRRLRILRGTQMACYLSTHLHLHLAGNRGLKEWEKGKMLSVFGKHSAKTSLNGSYRNICSTRHSTEYHTRDHQHMKESYNAGFENNHPGGRGRFDRRDDFDGGRESYGGGRRDDYVGGRGSYGSERGGRDDYGGARGSYGSERGGRDDYGGGRDDYGGTRGGRDSIRSGGVESFEMRERNYGGRVGYHGSGSYSMRDDYQRDLDNQKMMINRRKYDLLDKNSLGVPRGFTMRDRVAMRMKRRMLLEGGRTQREIRKAKVLKKKLMTEEERLIYALKRAKTKASLLIRELKKYEMPELPQPQHDPELLTPEILQRLRKIGFKNKNYAPMGVRGVFGGVVLNMHLHWKFHETVQICCDNYPIEKIKEIANMLARLSGGIVIHIHNRKTLIMYRGKNYRQPQVITPVNTLTKRKALYKARFEQALASQKFNIKKCETKLRRMGVNPEDPVAMASVQKVASTFFRALDDKQEEPYIFDRAKDPSFKTDGQEKEDSGDEGDQEALDRFIAEIEEAANEEWKAEEAAEKEDIEKILYWTKDEFDHRHKHNGWNADQRNDDWSPEISPSSYDDAHTDNMESGQGLKYVDEDHMNDAWNSDDEAFSIIKQSSNNQESKQSLRKTDDISGQLSSEE